MNMFVGQIWSLDEIATRILEFIGDKTIVMKNYNKELNSNDLRVEMKDCNFGTRVKPKHEDKKMASW